jgi:uncharacterized membrane protein YdjX (TVP38/TMEM64 family)
MTNIAWRPLILGAVSFLTVTILLFAVIHWIGLERLQTIIEQSGSLAPLAYIALRATTYVVAPLSSGPAQFTSGMLFGLWPGTFYSLIGEVIGGSINFWIARLLGRPAVRRLAGKAGLAKIDEYYERAGEWRTLIIARLILFSLYDFISYAAGLAPLKYRTYFLVSFIAGFIPTFAAVALGTRFEGENRVLWIVVALIGSVLVAVIALTNQRFRRFMGIDRGEEDKTGAP